MCFHHIIVSAYTDKTYVARIVFHFTNEHLLLPETGNVILLATCSLLGYGIFGRTQLPARTCLNGIMYHLRMVIFIQQH
jgi:hypothetical protein